jgi:hypothetical protein
MIAVLSLGRRSTDMRTSEIGKLVAIGIAAATIAADARASSWTASDELNSVISDSQSETVYRPSCCGCDDGEQWTRCSGNGGDRRWHSDLVRRRR